MAEEYDKELEEDIRSAKRVISEGIREAIILEDRFGGLISELEEDMKKEPSPNNLKKFKLLCEIIEPLKIVMDYKQMMFVDFERKIKDLFSSLLSDNKVKELKRNRLHLIYVQCNISEAMLRLTPKRRLLLHEIISIIFDIFSFEEEIPLDVKQAMERIKEKSEEIENLTSPDKETYREAMEMILERLSKLQLIVSIFMKWITIAIEEYQTKVLPMEDTTQKEGFWKSWSERFEKLTLFIENISKILGSLRLPF